MSSDLYVSYKVDYKVDALVILILWSKLIPYCIIGDGM